MPTGITVGLTIIGVGSVLALFGWILDTAGNRVLQEDSKYDGRDLERGATGCLTSFAGLCMGVIGGALIVAGGIVMVVFRFVQ